MTNIKIFFIMIGLSLLIGCQSAIYRGPSSILNLYESRNEAKKESLKDLRQRRVELSALSIHFQNKKNEFQLAKIVKEQKNIDKKIRELESKNLIY